MEDKGMNQSKKKDGEKGKGKGRLKHCNEP
jgi:hypothetical protein